MNRLPSALPARQLEELLPKAPLRPRPAAAPRQPGSAAAAAPPAHSVARQVRNQGKPAAPSTQETGGRGAAPSVREQPQAGAVLCGASDGASMDGQQGGGGDAQQDDTGPPSAAASSCAALADEADAIAALLPDGGSSGIFEVVLPNGELLGVAVESSPALLTCHLQAASPRTAERLRGQHRELAGHLERRIGKGVALTIL